MSEDGPRADREVVVMAQITKLFADLTRSEQARVLKWAGERYINAPIEEVDVSFFSDFVAGVAEAAREVGDVTPMQIIQALAKAREEEKPGQI